VRARRLAVVVVTTCVGAAGAAAATSVDLIPFRTVAQASASGVQPRRPTVLLATTPTGARRITALVRDVDAGRVRAADLSTSALVAAFTGAKPSSGYAVTIRRLTVRNGVLDVLVALRRPARGSYVLPAFTSPYAVAEIAHDAAAGAVRWRLVTIRNRVLGRGSFPR
jgi:protease stability complex PrcB-like protein